MTKLGDALSAGDQKVAFHAYGRHGQPWVKAEVTPSTVDGFWHVTVMEHGGVATFTKRPVQRDFVAPYLRNFGVADVDFLPMPGKPSRNNPWAPQQADAEAGDARDVYFIQGIEGGPIKIGVSRDPWERLAAIQLMSPVQLHVLGTIRGVGQPEERRLHERFAEHRSHGEWFHPAPELIDYIQENT
ncbi:GIY-YIG nuclease family protein [Streptosporangium sp. NPDC051022]|uniref:GIY-YIG nuclease family protein n=1 Tax=Streptosporangium sp. NPDC051022 TaxID=3155752 RepID=UPI00341ED116